MKHIPIHRVVDTRGGGSALHVTYIGKFKGKSSDSNGVYWHFNDTLKLYFKNGDKFYAYGEEKFKYRFEKYKETDLTNAKFESSNGNV
jgi:hypothetical protein